MEKNNNPLIFKASSNTVSSYNLETILHTFNAHEHKNKEKLYVYSKKKSRLYRYFFIFCGILFASFLFIIFKMQFNSSVNFFLENSSKAIKLTAVLFCLMNSLAAFYIGYQIKESIDTLNYFARKGKRKLFYLYCRKLKRETISYFYASLFQNKEVFELRKNYHISKDQITDSHEKSLNLIQHIETLKEIESQKKEVLIRDITLEFSRKTEEILQSFAL